MTAALKDATCETAEQALKAFNDALVTVKRDWDDILDQLPQTRATALARSNLETGFLWLEVAAREFGA